VLVSEGTPAATDGADFSVQASATIPGGLLCASVAVDLISDGEIEQNEQFVLTLNSSTNAVLATAITHTFTILEADKNNYPGGVPSSDFQFWVDASDVDAADGSAVLNWSDKSPNGFGALQLDALRQPIFRETGLNGKPALEFDGFDDNLTLGSNYLYSTGSGISLFSVLQSDSDKSFPLFFDFGYFASTGYGFGYDTVGAGVWHLNNTTGSNNASSWPHSQSTSPSLFLGEIEFLNNQRVSLGGNDPAFTTPITTSALTAAEISESPTRAGGSGPVTIGMQSKTANEADRNLDGKISEIIFFDEILSDSHQAVIEQSLGAKYNLPLATDLYAYQATHENQVTGILAENGAKVSTGFSGGLVVLESAGSLQDGESILAGHDNQNGITNTDVPSGIDNRWARTWAVDKTSIDGINAQISFDFSDYQGGIPGSVSDYRLLYRSSNTGTFSQIPVSAGLSETDRINFNLNDSQIANGYYTLGTADDFNSPLSIPEKPTGLSGSEYDGTTADLSWTAPGVSSSLPDDYVIEYSEDNFVSDIQIFNDGVSSNTFGQVTDLINETYYFRVRSKNPAGISQSSNVIEINFSPVISAISQNQGRGGNQITITGQNFHPNTAFSFGGNNALKTEYISASEFVVNVPPSSVAGTVDIVVTNPSTKSFTLAASYTYNFATPTSASRSVSTWGGQEITVTGNHFDAAYRQEIVATNPTNAPTNTSTFVRLDTKSLIETGKMRNDCGDIRIYNSFGQNVDYSVSECGFLETTIWFAADNLPAGNSSFYLEYGQMQNTSLSDLSSLFPVLTKASNKIWYSGSFQSTMTDFGQPVPTLHNHSPAEFNNFNGTAPGSDLTPTLQANVINGFPVISFDGNDEYDVGTVSSGLTGIAAFVVSKSDDVSSADLYPRLLSSKQSGNDFNSPDGWNITANQSGGTALTYPVDIRFRNSASGKVIDNLEIGHWGGCCNIHSDVAEILIFNEDLTTAERNQIFDYLQTKYAINGDEVSATIQPTIQRTNLSVEVGGKTVAAQFISETEIQFISPSLNIGSYPIAVINRDGQSGTGSANLQVNAPQITSVADNFDFPPGGKVVTVSGTDLFAVPGKYVRQIQLTHLGSPINNYQAPITLDTASLIAASKMRNDCGDIRLYDQNAGRLPYFVESGCNTSSTIIWTRLDTLATGANTAYISYGDLALTSQNSANQVFISNQIAFGISSSGIIGNAAGAVNTRSVMPFSVSATSQINTETADINQAHRYRFLFVPQTTGNYSFLTNSDDGSEIVLTQADSFGGGWSVPTDAAVDIVATWYGGHGRAGGLCGTGGTTQSRTLTAGQGYWIDYTQQNGHGTGVSRMCIDDGNGYELVAVNTFANQLFSCQYPSLSNSDPIINLQEEKPGASITFDGIPVEFVLANETEVQVRVPARSGGVVDVVLTDGYGNTSTLGSSFEYRPPTISAISPQNGHVSGGTEVTITGTNFSQYSFEQTLTLTNSTSLDLTDYQAPITLDTASLIATGKMRNDCGDIRLYDATGAIALPHSLEGGCDTTSTELFVKIPSLSANSSVQIVLQYGNLSLQSASNPADVFDIYDLHDIDDAPDCSLFGSAFDLPNEAGVMLTPNQINIAGHCDYGYVPQNMGFFAEFEFNSGGGSGADSV